MPTTSNADPTAGGTDENSRRARCRRFLGKFSRAILLCGCFWLGGPTRGFLLGLAPDVPQHSPVMVANNLLVLVPLFTFILIVVLPWRKWREDSGIKWAACLFYVQWLVPIFSFCLGLLIVCSYVTLRPWQLEGIMFVSGGILLMASTIVIGFLECCYVKEPAGTTTSSTQLIRSGQELQSLTAAAAAAVDHEEDAPSSSSTSAAKSGPSSQEQPAEKGSEKGSAGGGGGGGGECASTQNPIGAAKLGGGEFGDDGNVAKESDRTTSSSSS